MNHFDANSFTDPVEILAECTVPAIVEATDSRVFGKERVGLDSLCPVVFDMKLKMTNRQRLDQTLLSVAGEDIRLVGNWERLPGLFGNAEQLAERLNVSKSQLLRCQDIADVLGLMDNGPLVDSADNGPTLF